MCPFTYRPKCRYEGKDHCKQFPVTCQTEEALAKMKGKNARKIIVVCWYVYCVFFRCTRIKKWLWEGCAEHLPGFQGKKDTICSPFQSFVWINEKKGTTWWGEFEVDKSQKENFQQSSTKQKKCSPLMCKVVILKAVSSFASTPPLLCAFSVFKFVKLHN
jgi:hypothetical protein